MVALQTSDSDPRTEPIETMVRLRLVDLRSVEPVAPRPHWSAAHPAVRAQRGQLPSSPGSAEASVTRPRGAPVRRRRLVYLRRRLVAAVVLLALMWAVVAVVTELIGGGSGSAGAAEELRSHVVVPGDTWWSLAGDLDRPGDVRDTVDSLIELNRSEDLRAGQRVVLPVG